LAAEDMAAEKLAGFGVGDEFDEAIALPLRKGFADGEVIMRITHTRNLAAKRAEANKRFLE